LLELQVRTLYRVDRLGRLVCVNDLGEPEPPRLFIGTGSDGSRVVRVGIGVGEREWRALLRCGGDPEAVRATLETRAPVEREHRGPAYALPGDLRGGSRAVPVTGTAMLHPELAPWGPELEARRPCFGVLDGGLVVSICCCARTTAEAAEAGVETATAYRGRGMAGHAVAAWAEAVIASGRVAFYSTSRENLASQAVARKLGAVQFGEDWSLA
jgi:hypothetical protein